MNKEHKVAVDYQTETGGKCSCGADGYVCPRCKRALCSYLSPQIEGYCAFCLAHKGEK